jgi:hypothetical protein
MNDFAVWWKNMCIGSFFLFLIILISGVIHWPEHYGDIAQRFYQALHVDKNQE